MRPLSKIHSHSEFHSETVFTVAKGQPEAHKKKPGEAHIGQCNYQSTLELIGFSQHIRSRSCQKLQNPHIEAFCKALTTQMPAKPRLESPKPETLGPQLRPSRPALRPRLWQKTKSRARTYCCCMCVYIYMYVCMYVCMCICVCACARQCILTYIMHAYTHVYIVLFVCVPVYVYIYIYTCIHVLIYM